MNRGPLMSFGVKSVIPTLFSRFLVRVRIHKNGGITPSDHSSSLLNDSFYFPPIRGLVEVRVRGIDDAYGSNRIYCASLTVEMSEE